MKDTKCPLCGKPLDNKFEIMFHVITWHNLIRPNERGQTLGVKC